MFKPFTLFDLPESYPLNENERSRIFRYVDRYAETMEGAWLHALNYRAIKLKWCCGMTQENGIMGCFAAMTDTIYLQPEDVYKAVPGSAWVELMAPTLIHELRHVWQWRSNPLKYLFCAIPVLREITLERDAWEIEEHAQKICDKLMETEDSWKFELAQRRKHGNS